ncbi:MAG: YlxR family protein [Candidatus Dormibacteria bacterium]
MRLATADRGVSDPVPLRTCTGCRTVRPKSELVRLAVTAASGRVTLDPSGRAPGRGAYVCRESGITCLHQSRRHRSLARSLRVGDDVIDELTLAAALRELVMEEST